MIRTARRESRSVHYKDGEKRYILAPKGLGVGDSIEAGPDAEMRVGNAVAAREDHARLDDPQHRASTWPRRTACEKRRHIAQLVAKEGSYAHVRLPSGEVRMIHLRCYATVGEVGNADHENISIGKAGRTRWKGKRPTVRGVAMNPVDHPMGGGEGKSSGGRHPCTPWGVPTKGKKTRKKKLSDKMILRRRKKQGAR
jgi:large subunit ribosomal protein L2